MKNKNESDNDRMWSKYCLAVGGSCLWRG